MSMEAAMTEAARQVPALVVLVIVVLIFVSYLTKRDDSCNEVQRDSKRCIEENSRVIGEVSECLRQNNLVVREINTTLVRMNGK